jgi:hypothetical protein
MKAIKISFWILFFGSISPYLFVITALIHWGEPLYLHDPKELFGNTVFSLITAYSGLSYLLSPIFSIVLIYLMVKRRIKFFSPQLFMLIILSIGLILFCISPINYWIFWFAD